MSSSVWDGRRFCCSSQAASSTFLHQRYQSGGEQQRLLFPRGTPVLLVMKAMQLPAVTTHVDESKVALETYPEPTQASMRLVFGCQPLPSALKKRPSSDPSESSPLTAPYFCWSPFFSGMHRYYEQAGPLRYVRWPHCWWGVGLEAPASTPQSTSCDSHQGSPECRRS